MKIFLYETINLEEKISRKLRVWKAWHITLYVLIAVFGILNFTFLLKTKELVDDNCVFYPVVLEFHMVNVHDEMAEGSRLTLNLNDKTKGLRTEGSSDHGIDTGPNKTQVNNNKKLTVVDKEVTKREISASPIEDYDSSEDNITNNATGNSTHMALQTDRTLFGEGSQCEFAEYMPVLSTIFAVVWITMFTMCPGGGRSRSGLQEPWRILAPAFIFAVLMLVFTGFSFTTTNGGLQAFCASFHNVTNTTTCSAVNPFLERSRGVSWGFGGRAAATRAASAAVWAGWACAAALLLARCMVAPDFALRRTEVYLTSDPQQKIVPSLKKNPSRSSSYTPRRARDDASVRSEPTFSSQLVTASVEHEAGDSAPTSLVTTPVKEFSVGEMVELAQSLGQDTK